jgi:hypothetical protein
VEINEHLAVPATLLTTLSKLPRGGPTMLSPGEVTKIAENLSQLSLVASVVWLN